MRNYIENKYLQLMKFVQDAVNFKFADYTDQSNFITNCIYQLSLLQKYAMFSSDSAKINLKNKSNKYTDLNQSDYKKQTSNIIIKYLAYLFKCKGKQAQPDYTTAYIQFKPILF